MVNQEGSREAILLAIEKGGVQRKVLLWEVEILKAAAPKHLEDLYTLYDSQPLGPLKAKIAQEIIRGERRLSRIKELLQSHGCLAAGIEAPSTSSLEAKSGPSMVSIAAAALSASPLPSTPNSDSEISSLSANEEESSKPNAAPIQTAPASITQEHNMPQSDTSLPTPPQHNIIEENTLQADDMHTITTQSDLPQANTSPAKEATGAFLGTVDGIIQASILAEIEKVAGAIDMPSLWERVEPEATWQETIKTIMCYAKEQAQLNQLVKPNYKSSAVCFNCERKGHIVKYCPMKAKAYRRR
ncbi:hypothetical protein NEHOM01_1984 [Nematocida homosporus]|uniref:uncharacterized protein n=1 Tax=Nematocida homosporus TaxID=1912981 RepID=UPI002220A659|nr:uncharacterized protein NEHOM01_1984 [Nematocida homosporus]KAI5187175.1 hypothetical protein NEHOM01_1984 [Nematocida homosporus]